MHLNLLQIFKLKTNRYYKKSYLNLIKKVLFLYHKILDYHSS